MLAEKTASLYGRWKKTIIIAVCLYVPLYIAWLFLGRESVNERLIIGSISLLFSSLAAFSLAVWVTSSMEKGAIRTAWTWLSMGLLLWTLSDAARLISSGSWLQSNTVTMLRDGILLLGFLPIWIGLMLYPRTRLVMRNQIQLWINITVSTTALVTLIWIIFITPLQQISIQSGGSWTASYIPDPDDDLLYTFRHAENLPADYIIQFGNRRISLF
jgi:hypothetical protein